MLINISELEPQGIRLSERVQVPRFSWEGGATVACSPVAIEGSLRPSSRGIELQVELRTVAELTCTRCLRQHDAPIEGNFRLFVVQEDEREAKVEETLSAGDLDAVDLYPLAGEQLNLVEVLQEQIDLLLPLKPVCSDSCAGLCAKCGADRNHESCLCEQETDDRWSALKQLRENSENRKGHGPSERR